MEFLIPILFDKFRRIPEGFYKKPKKYFNTERIVKRLFKSSNLEINNIKFNLLNDAGDDEILENGNHRIPKDYIHVYTPCIIRDDFLVEVADIVCKPYGDLEIINHRYGSIPTDLKKFGIELFKGRRPFYYRGKTISLQMRFSADELDIDPEAEKLFLTLPKIYKDIEAQRWVGSPRIKIYLKAVKLI